METKEKEVWKDIPGYNNYQASSMGRIRSVDRTAVDSMGRKRFYRGRILDGNISKTTGYRQVRLSVNGEGITLRASQIVALTFLNHKPDGNTLVVDHINGNRLDDRIENLQIVTHRKNTTTCFRKHKKTLSSRHIGVNWSKSNSKWCARIVFEGKQIYLGYYDDELEASKSYQNALARIEDGTFNVNDYEPNFTSKYKGVVFHKQAKKWMSYTYVNGKRKHVGLYPTELEAYEALEKFKQNLSQKK